MLREVREELGLDIARATYIGTYPFERLNQISSCITSTAARRRSRSAADELADYSEMPLERDEAVAAGHGAGAYAIGS